MKTTTVAMTLLATLAAPAFAAEGMWTLDNLPLKQMQAQYGFAPSTAWVDKLRQASLRVAGGCSGAFVSANGLVMTNHHCVIDCVEQLSSASDDRVANGFLARERGLEPRCPEVELNRLDSISDVTAAVKEATRGLSGEAYQKAQNAVQARLTKECRGDDTERTRCDLVSLYQGGQYQLYRYHRYADVRLVWVPEFAIANFGGDPDNFMFPRYALDIALLRAYEDGKPVQTQHFFPLKAEGAEPGELTLVTGHPGDTQRLLTVAQLETLRDRTALHTLPRLSELRGLQLQYARQGAEQARQVTTELEGTENYLKVLRGELLALSEPALLQAKRDEERKLQAFIRSRPELKREVGDAFAAMAGAQARARQLAPAHDMVEGGRAFNSAYFRHARTLVRGAAERALPNGERLRQFADNNLPQLEQALESPAPIYPALETARLGWALSKLRETLGPDDELVKQVLGAESPEAMAARLVAGTQLAAPAERMRLWRGGLAAVQASSDPFIQLALRIEPRARALRAQWEAEVQAVEEKSAERIALARFARTGKGTYPDATFTLRLSYGEVKGWPVRGQPVAPYTDFGGAFKRATGAAPFALPPSWLARQGQLNLQQRFNFVSNNDIIGGNSGSPMINAKGEVVGLVFDGNIDSIGGAFSFDERVNRTVAVHSGAILAVLQQVYDAGFLADELTGTRSK
ncbi:MAG: S46 family peptidase [Burkholderiaceae bacterium]|nr:S46 family peptidase [Burkholderiaceae bacterium]